MSIPTLHTSNLLLRSWTPEDATALFEILQEPDILKYFPPTCFTLEKTQRYIAHQLKHWQERGFGHWAVVTPSDGHVVGWSGLEYLPELDEIEIAYLLRESVRGRGYATEAALSAIKFCFGTCHLPTIIGLVHPNNIPSIRVLEKCGLVYSNPVTLWGLDMHRYRLAQKEKSAV
jgi:ribosomal-protein-alanine N-acetyltransferase